MDQYPTFEQLSERHKRQPRAWVRRKTRPLVVPRVKYNRLRKWFEREPQPMSLKEFAKLIGVTPSYVSQLCRDEPPWPKRHIARKIGIVTRGYVTPNHLAGYSGWLVPPDSSDDA